MVVFAIALMILFVGGGAILSLMDQDLDALWIGTFLAAFVAFIWFVCAVPYSDYEKDTCQERAQGYGLKRSEWSFQNNCRVYLSNGRLVPIDDIRITQEGDLFVSND